MPTLVEVLANREQYPDTLTYKVGEQEYTLGDLRNSTIPKADHTKELNRFQAEKQQLQQTYQQHLTQYNQQLQQLNAELQRRGQPPSPTVDDAASRLEADAADPTLGPYAKAISKLLGEVETVKQKLVDTEKRVQQHEETWWLDKHSQVLNRIRESDSEYKDEAKVQELLRYAQQHSIPNLDLAYQLHTKERDLQRAGEKAVKEAEERLTAQQNANAQAPHIPAGTVVPGQGSAGQAWTPPEGTLDPWEAAKDAALQDPELEKIGAQFAAGYDGRAPQ